MSRTSAKAAVEQALPGGGWPWLAASMLLTAGAYNAAWGASAIAGDNPFSPDDLLLSGMDTQVWGALTLAWGLSFLVAAALVYARRTSGTQLGRVLAVAALVTQALALKDSPGWAIGAMALSLLLLYALTRARRTIDSAA